MMRKGDSGVLPKVTEHGGIRSRAAGQGSSSIDVATPAHGVCRRPELPLKLHQAPDLGAVPADAGSTLAATSWMVRPHRTGAASGCYDVADVSEHWGD
jgi:hypothetical protein